MAGARGIPPDHVAALNALQREPHRFTLFAALRLIEQLDAARPRIGTARRPADERIRLEQPPHLNFAASDLGAVTHLPGERIHIEQFGFGIFGPNGALPLHLTQFAMDRRRHHDDPAVSDFVNLFQHRLTELFYRAWADSDPVASQTWGASSTGFDAALGALIGLAAAPARQRDSVPDHAKFFRAGLLAPAARSADGLQSVLAGYFEVPVHIRQFVGHWLRVPEGIRTRIRHATDPSAVLGSSATLGTASWQAQSKFEVVVGPLAFARFVQFLPGSRALQELTDFVRLYTCEEWAWQLRLQVLEGEAPGVALGRSSRLGWTSWLGSKHGVADEVVLQCEVRAAA